MGRLWGRCGSRASGSRPPSICLTGKEPSTCNWRLEQACRKEHLKQRWPCVCSSIFPSCLGALTMFLRMSRSRSSSSIGRSSWTAAVRPVGLHLHPDSSIHILRLPRPLPRLISMSPTTAMSRRSTTRAGGARRCVPAPRNQGRETRRCFFRHHLRHPLPLQPSRPSAPHRSVLLSI